MIDSPMSKLKFRIGPSARRCLERTSPYAMLLVDIGYGLASEDVSGFKLVLQADKLASRRQICELKNGADVLSFLDSREYISNTCTEFLQHILIQVGRKDLEIRVQKYLDRMKKQHDKENTAKKEVQVFTQLNSVDSGELKEDFKQLSLQTEVKEELSAQTRVKEIYDSSLSSTRPVPEGKSTSSSLEETATVAFCQESAELNLSQTFSLSPMSVDSSQGSVFNSTDEEKIGNMSDKVWLLETDEVMSSQ